VDRIVSKNGAVHLAGRCILAAEILGGRGVCVRVEQTTLMFSRPARRPRRRDTDTAPHPR
jgi:hypothetical protein